MTPGDSPVAPRVVWPLGALRSSWNRGPVGTQAQPGI